jgi:hypothetical protein
VRADLHAQCVMYDARDVEAAGFRIQAATSPRRGVCDESRGIL